MRTNYRFRDLLRPLATTLAAASFLTVSCSMAHSMGTEPGGTANSPAGASSVKPDPAAATIRQAVESRYAGAHVLDVQPSAIPGVYELFMGDQIVYSDASGD